MNQLSKYSYFDFKLTCLDNYVKYINSSEGSFYPKNPYEICNYLVLNYIYNFEKIKQDLDKKICLYIVNCWGPGHFSFDYASVNEYIITNVDYENWYSCDNCDYNKEQKFVTSNFTCGRIKFCL